MARDVFVEIGDARSVWTMRLEVTGHGRIPVGTVTRGRFLLPFGRPRLEDPKHWVALEIVGVEPKAIGNAAVYRARKTGGD